jgi:hypothetical protein
MPSCAIYLMGIVGDTHYWATSTCPISQFWGYGVTPAPLANYGCNETGCLGGVQPLLKTKVNKLEAGDIEAAKTFCRDRLAYLNKLIASSQVENAGPGSRKPRLRVWLVATQKAFDYLERNTNHSDAEKLAWFNSAYAVHDMEHQQAWSHVMIHRNTNPRTPHLVNQVLLDQQQQSRTYDPEIEFTRGKFNGTIENMLIVKARFSGNPDPVYFKLFEFRAGDENAESFTHSLFIGVQISEPANPGEAVPCAIVDRHQHAHKIKVTSGNLRNQEFLVSSFDSLEIP